jgi:hypothetical protein
MSPSSFGRPGTRLDRCGHTLGRSAEPYWRDPTSPCHSRDSSGRGTRADLFAAKVRRQRRPHAGRNPERGPILSADTLPPGQSGIGGRDLLGGQLLDRESGRLPLPADRTFVDVEVTREHPLAALREVRALDVRRFPGFPTEEHQPKTQIGERPLVDVLIDRARLKLE